MLITIRIPDKAVKILYVEDTGGGYESEPKSVTMGMIVRVEEERNDGERDGEEGERA